MAKVAASGTHLAEARSQSAQGFRVFSFSVRIPIFSFYHLLFGRRSYSIEFLSE
ncbi:hypothetical protein ACTQ4Q_00680 [Bacillota bacterium LCP21S3_D9]